MESLNISVNGWQSLNQDKYHTTSGYFEGGAVCVVETGEATRGDEVHIMRGVAKVIEDEGGTGREVVEFEGVDYVPDGAKYRVSTHKNDVETAVNYRFAQTLEEAVQIVNQEAQKLTDGTL